MQARIIVANITGRNPNVYYELGIAHAIDKPVIMIAQNKSDLPFDIRAKQIIFYNDNQQLEKELVQMLARVLANHNNEPSR